MSTYIVSLPNPVVNGTNPKFSAILRLTSTGALENLITLGVTRVVLNMAGVTLDSSSYPAAIDYTTNGASGMIDFDLTGFAYPAGLKGAAITIYYPAQPAGVVVVESLAISISSAIAGTAAVYDADLEARLASSDSGKGADLVAYDDDGATSTVSAALNTLFAPMRQSAIVASTSLVISCYGDSNTRHNGTIPACKSYPHNLAVRLAKKAFSFGAVVHNKGTASMTSTWGVANLTAVGLTAEAWTKEALSAYNPATNYSEGQVVEPTTPNDFKYTLTTDGSGPAVEPTWGTTIGGTTTDASGNVWTAALIPYTYGNGGAITPQIVVLGFGTNDITQGSDILTTYLANMQTLITAVRAAGATPIILGIPWFSSGYSAAGYARLANWNEKLKALAYSNGCELVDLYGASELSTNYTEYYLNEVGGYRHFNWKGVEFIADMVMAAIEKVANGGPAPMPSIYRDNFGANTFKELIATTGINTRSLVTLVNYTPFSTFKIPSGTSITVRAAGFACLGFYPRKSATITITGCPGDDIAEPIVAVLDDSYFLPIKTVAIPSDGTEYDMTITATGGDLYLRWFACTSPVVIGATALDEDSSARPVLEAVTLSNNSSFAPLKWGAYYIKELSLEANGNANGKFEAAGRVVVGTEAEMTTKEIKGRMPHGAKVFMTDLVRLVVASSTGFAVGESVTNSGGTALGTVIEVKSATAIILRMTKIRLVVASTSGFTVGEAVTNSGSTALGEVAAIESATAMLVTMTSGTFVAGQSIDDANPYSSALTTITSVEVPFVAGQSIDNANPYSAELTTITTVYVGQGYRWICPNPVKITGIEKISGSGPYLYEVTTAGDHGLADTGIVVDIFDPLAETLHEGNHTTTAVLASTTFRFSHASDRATESGLTCVTGIFRPAFVSI